jgi:hypothetical protein
MAFSLLALLHPTLIVYTQHPLWAELSGLQSQVDTMCKITGIKPVV